MLRRPSPTSLKKRCVFALVSIMFSLFVSLLLGEALLRIAAPARASLDRDPVLGDKGAPGGQLDARGYRNAEALAAADVVIMGDSQTYGVNATMEEAWPQTFSRMTGKSVYQMAFGGWSAAQYAALLPDALALRPQDIIVAFYTGNDLLDTVNRVYVSEFFKAYRSSEFRPPNGGEAIEADDRAAGAVVDAEPTPAAAERRFFPPFVYGASAWIRSKSRLYAFAGDVTRDFRQSVGLSASEERNDDRIDTLKDVLPEVDWVFPDEEVPTLLSSSYRFPTVNMESRDVQEGWRITQALLNDMRAKLPEGVGFTLVIIPTKELAYLEVLRARNETPPAAFVDYEREERRLLEEVDRFCRAEAFTCISTLEALAGSIAAGNAAYGDDIDGHPKGWGYRMIAEAVAAAMSR